MKFVQAPFLRGALGAVAGVLAGFVVSLPIVVLAGDLLPIVSIRSPLLNQTVGGYVTVSAMSDSTGVVGLRFQIDGQDLGSEITSGSCKAIWDSTQKADGLHTIQAVGRDQYGNLTLSQPVTVLVSNPPFPTPTPIPAPGPTPTPPATSPAATAVVTITAPVAGTSVSGTTVSIATTFPVESEYLTYFLLDKDTGAVRWTTRGLQLERSQTSSSVTVNTSVVPAGSYDLQVVARVDSTDVASPKTRLSFAAPPVMSFGAMGGRDFTLVAGVARGGIAVPGVLVTFVVTSPQGVRWTYSATTSSAGFAVVQARLPANVPRGTYRVTATATTAGVALTASGSFIY